MKDKLKKAIELLKEANCPFYHPDYGSDDLYYHRQHCKWCNEKSVLLAEVESSKEHPKTADNEETIM